MLFQFLTFLKYYWRSGNAHSVHSPFVFQLYTKGFKSTPPANNELLKRINQYKDSLYGDKRVIEVTDFGAGSRVFKSNTREIRKIAKTAGISAKNGQLLMNLIHYLKPKRILEIGTSLGISTAYMALAAPNSRIATLEGCKETASVAEKQFRDYKLDNIDLLVGTFADTLPKVLAEQHFDLVFFDGNHQKAPTLQYFDLCLKQATDNAIFIFDDIHWNSEMEDAWNLIKENPRVTVSIDTFRWGLVFFRSEQVKQDFILRP
jgi:predicted O-methyltransferase YrrM